LGMKDDVNDLERADGFTVEDKRFWARKESGATKQGERPPRKSEFPTVVEQLQAQMETSREKLKERLDQLEKEKADFRRRITAEMERRLEQEKLGIVHHIIEILDMLESAVGSSANDPEKTIEGLNIIRDDIFARLAKMGVEGMESLGKPFDPEQHDAVMTRKAPPEKDGIVLEVIKPGYRVGESILRHAEVVVGSAEE
jgi:molecular chaperone GrpE